MAINNKLLCWLITDVFMIYCELLDKSMIEIGGFLEGISEWRRNYHYS